jgi:probable phosphoglycerate mutase
MRQRSILLIRHGATKLNSEDNSASVDKIRGWLDVPLTAEGRAGAKKTAARLKDSGIEVIVSSDLQRAHDTAKEIAKACGADVVTTQKLRPWDLGVMTGQESKTSLPKIEKYVRAPDTVVPKGESFGSFRARALQGLCDVVKGHAGKKIAIVTHHRVERLLEAWTKKGQPADHDIDVATFLKKGEPPGGVKTVTLDRHALARDAEGSDAARREEELEGMMSTDIETYHASGAADELLDLKRKRAATEAATEKAAPAKKKASPLARQVGVPGTGTKSIKKKFGIDSPGTQPPAQQLTSRNPPN